MPGRKIRPWKTLALLILCLALLAGCQLPASQEPIATFDENILLTQGASTVVAELTAQGAMISFATETQAALLAPTFTATSETAPPTTEPSATATQPPAAATATPTSALPTNTSAPPTATTTSAVPTATPTLAVGQITALRDTNCRQGPGSAFEVVDGLRTGRTTAVYGRDAGGNWWYVQRPNGKADEYCWVWENTTDVTGNVNNYPVIPPYPVQLSPVRSQWAFNMPAVNIHMCGVPTLFLMVDNIGPNPLESAQLEIWNASTGRVLFTRELGNQPFAMTDKDCTGNYDTLGRGDQAFVRAPLADVLPGHIIAVNLALCTAENMEGRCYYETVSFAMP
jgi:hypothetical protein